MGSSDTGGGVVDCSVGSIVWVRRRNGSWWPGKILGPEELSASHVTSRSGTPVKLLGREDASVDWYNLEKSKRVKAFRCGEFDECIERAEAAQGMPPKKREKYARREDAIMHALELERQLFAKKYGKSENSSWTRSKVSPDGVTSSNCMGNESENKNGNLSNASCENLGSSVFEKNETNQQLYEEKLREEKNHGEEDGAGMLPRMRGLQDFGLLSALSTGEEILRVTPRAKRSKYSHLQYDSLVHANDNPSGMDILVSKPEETPYPGDHVHQVTGSTEDTETDCSETDSSEPDSDEDLINLSDGSASIELHPKYPRRVDVHEDHGSISSIDDLDGLPYSNAPLIQDQVASGSEVSKLGRRRERKIQNLGKKASDSLGSETSSGYLNIVNSNGRSVSKDDLMDKRANLLRYSSKGLPNSYAIKGYWDEYANLYSGDKHSARFMLVDVELQVNGNNYRRNVPMISLTSKLNGHAIVGQPIQVEALENGFSQNFLSTTEPMESPALTSVWRTGRRTANFRVPRPFLSPRLNVDIGSIHEKSNVGMKSYSQSPRERKKSPKLNASSSMKIRSLSSIPAEDSLIKTRNVPTAVSCIPVNLVFSRLHEELMY